jgi:hypothetical protein
MAGKNGGLCRLVVKFVVKKSASQVDLGPRLLTLEPHR